MSDKLFDDLTNIMNNKLLIGAFAAFTFFLGYPNPFLHLPLLVLIFPAVLLVFALYATGGRQAFRMGFLTGLAGYSAALYWIAVPVHDFGYFPWLVALPFPILLGAYVALYSGLFCLIMYKASPLLCSAWPLVAKERNKSTSKNTAKPATRRVDAFALLKLALFAGLSWALLEYLRGWAFSGFPWLTISSAFVPWPWAIQALSALGGYGLSGLYVALAAACILTAHYLYEQLQEKNTIKKLSPIFSPIAFILISLFFLTAWTFNAFAPQSVSTTAVGVLLVQGNINQDQKWNPAYQQTTFQIYRTLTEQALRKLKDSPQGYNHQAQTDSVKYTPPLQLVIWPETAMPFFYLAGGPFSEEIKNLAIQQNINIVFGAPDFEPIPGKTFQDFPIYNRAYLVNSQGQNLGFYEKEQLVPFGEYAPAWLRLPVFDFFLAHVGSIEPGKRTAPLKIQDIALGMLICYEAIFQELAQQRVANGAELLITISNDAWFGATSAPEQHLQLSIMRAVEQRRWLVRSTNTGITAVINPLGQRVIQGSSFTQESIASLAYARNDLTLFHLVEPYLPVIFSSLSLLLLVPGILRQIRIKKTTPSKL